ncbi:MAG: hypothetical protein AB7P49_09275, partial [Bdellovibrionales bacterium]
MSKRQRQLAFQIFKTKHLLVQGGDFTKGHPRERRPLCTKRSIHLVMRSSVATGRRSFLQKDNNQAVRLIVWRQAQRFGIKVYERVPNWTH